MAIYSLNGRVLSQEEPFEHNGDQYASIESLSKEQQDALGIVELESYPNYDQRFWWGVTPEGDYIPKRLEGLIELWVKHTNDEAGRKLSETDWMVIREIDNGTKIPNDVKTLRQEIRDASNQKVIRIKDSLNVGTLAQYLTSSEYNSWPSYSNVVDAEYINVGIATI
jgi:hypothetical protein